MERVEDTLVCIMLSRVGARQEKYGNQHQHEAELQRRHVNKPQTRHFVLQLLQLWLVHIHDE